MTRQILYSHAALCMLVLAGNATAQVARTGAQATVPPALRPALYRALAESEGPAYRIGTDGCAALPGQSLQACFDGHGAHFRSERAPSMVLHLVAYGRDAKLVRIGTAHPIIKGNRVTYRYGGLNEWWRKLPTGFEQGFTITRRPHGHGKLMLALSVSRDPRFENGVLAWGNLRYGKLVATDAKGNVIPATLRHSNKQIRIELDDAHASYPLTVDPLVWLEQKVTSTVIGTGEEFGTSVAFSGTTALVGAAFLDTYGNRSGAVYAFTKSDGAWQQTAKLTAGENFGISIALDGTTALIGAPQCYVDVGFERCNDTPGAAYVFTESGDSWSQVAKLTPADGTGGENFGSSVALSGTTAFVGASHATVNGNTEQGAIYVFTNSSGNWLQTQKLTASNGGTGDNFGNSVALAGPTALIGAVYANTVSPPQRNFQGAVYVFDESGGTWSQTQELTTGKLGDGFMFGNSISLSGTTALIGAPFENVLGSYNGAVYAFDESAGNWTQTQIIPSTDGEYFGYSVALSGSTALVGAPYTYVPSPANQQSGTAYLYTRTGNGWSQVQRFVAKDREAANYGSAVALSGTTGLIGAPNTGGDSGAVYFETESILDLALSEPSSVDPGKNYISQIIATNGGTATSPAVVLTAAVPAAASFISATASQGSCSEDYGVVTCNLGQVGGNAGTASANVTFKAICAGKTINNTASIAANPALTAKTPTVITGTQTPPVAYDATITASPGIMTYGTMHANDANCDPLTFSIADNPSHGSAIIRDASTGTYTYTPVDGYSGSDSFTFKANDGHANSNIATIKITVRSPGGGGGGGGGITGWWSLLVLLGFALMGALPRHRHG